jgi:myxalamid-type polyketide synthase MxaD
MSAQIDQYKSRLREALGIINGLKARVDTLEGANREPIAIIGYGCRFPGGPGPDGYWRVLEEGIDAIREIPEDRWAAEVFEKNRTEVRWAGLLEDLARFDAAFFSISPREAESLDPQQRMLLEVSWEAIEHAGQRIDTPLANRTGVFVGICSADYQQLVGDVRGGDFDAYCGTGNALSAAAGRISYSLGFQGPAISVDTACSSSLTALAEACQALRAHHCDMALAGGVNAILSSRTMAMLAGTQALSADGRCKSFDARANGFVRGEGCGIVVVKRLSDAIANNDRICGIIRGWVINQDGRSTGLTTPNVLSQKVMLNEALERARLSPADIDYVETHGTGTSLGDPIEAEALIDILGAPRADGSTCTLGAVKTNIGHLEGAAGAAGLIKVLLSLEHQKIPKNLHFKRLNPRISLQGTPLTIASEPVAWPRGNRPRRAGISSFGISGTNAHIIVEEPPARDPSSIAESTAPILLPLSAKSPQSLLRLAQNYVDWLPASNATLQDIAYTASARRVHHDHRLAVVAENRDELARLLSWAARGEMPTTAAITRAKVVFVFPGQGSQWLGMGRQLLEKETVFRAAIETCSAAIQDEAGFSILAALTSESQSRLDEIDVIQPVLFAIAVALAALWRSWGIIPDCVIGHSMGEVAAAHVAGVLTLEDAAKVICRRSRLLRKIRGRGTMALVELPMVEAERAIAAYSDKLGIAVSNGPRSTVLSGDPGALDEVLASLESRNIFCRRIKVDVASHSPQVDVLRDELLAALRDIRPIRGNVAIRSTVTGKVLQGPEMDAAYWVNNLRQPVRFSNGVQDLIRDGQDIFIEMSPHPILLPSIEENLKDLGSRGVAIPSMRREANERRTLLESLGTAYMFGAPVEWDKLFPQPGAVVTLPAYPWQQDRYWITADRPLRKQRKADGHPLLGARSVASTNPKAIFWHQDLALEDVPYLADHRIGGQVLFPGAAYIESALAAAREQLRSDSIVIEDLTFSAPLILTPEQPRRTEVFLERTESNAWRFRFSSMNPEDAANEGGPIWTLHAEALVRSVPDGASIPAPSSLADVKTRCTSEVPIADIWQRETNLGLEMGPAFRGLNRLYRSEQELLGRVDLPSDVPFREKTYSIHPALLDGALRAAAQAIPGNAAGAPRLLTHIRRLSFVNSPGRTLWTHAFVDATTQSKQATINLFDDSGAVSMTIEGFETRVALGMQGALECRNDVFLTQTWLPVELASGARERTRGRWLLLADDQGLAERIREHLMGRGNDVVCIWMRDETSPQRAGRLEMDPANASEMRTILADVLRSGAPLAGIVHCWGIGPMSEDENSPQSLDKALRRSCAGALHVAQILTRMSIRDIPRLWLLSQGSHAIESDLTNVDAAQSLLWGLGRMITLEFPMLKCTRIDLDPRQHAPVDSLLREFLARDTADDELAFRGTQRFVSRLTRIEPPARSNTNLILDVQGSYLVTGGLGGMGLLAASWLVRAGARNITLVDIEEITSDNQRQQLADLASLEVDIKHVRADITDRDQVATIVENMRHGARPLRGIIHCAGLFDAANLTQRTIEQLRPTLLPRMLGGLNLHRETQHHRLDFLIFFSSIHAWLGSSTLGGDVMGNVFLESLAARRTRLGLPTSVIHWGPFEGIGMETRLVGPARQAQHGMEGFSTDDGAALFLRVMRDALPNIGLAAFDFRRWVQSHVQAAGLPRLRSLTEIPKAAKPQTNNQDNDFLNKIKQATATIRLELLEQFLQQQLAVILRTDPSRIHRVAPLRGLGIDSLMSLELRNRLEAALPVRLSATIVWSHPTIEIMAKHIADLLVPPETSPSVVEESVDMKPLDLPTDDIDESSLVAVAEDHDLFKSFDQSIERMRRRRKS